MFVAMATIAVYHPRVRIPLIWVSATIVSYLFSSNQMFFTRYWYLPGMGVAVIYALAIHWASGLAPEKWRNTVSATLVAH